MNSSRLVLNSATQRSFVASAARRSAFRSPGFNFSRSRVSHYQPAFLVYAVRRSIVTETSTPSAPAGLPPGFNAEEAKKPLPSSTTTVVKPVKPAPTAKPVGEPKVEAAKAETTEKAFSKDMDAATEAAGTELMAGEKKKEEKKLTVWQKVKHGAQHFWDGTKLLGAEIKISTNLALKMAAGYELSRRERRQLQRTVRDLGRLVPFSVFIIVPAGELFLPVALKLFPNLLPSTYEDQKAKEAKLDKLRNTRKDVSDFLRTTLKESGIPLSPKTRQREEFTNFFKKLRSGSEHPSNEDVIRVCKIFRDDVTLDNLSRPQLVGMCRYMNLNSFGPDTMLRYSIRHRMRQIKRDDRAISYEGIESLSVSELQNACASRGIRTHGVSPARLRQDLSTWLELRLKHGVPSTLLVLSNAFMYAQGKENEIESHYDALQAVLSSIPEELYHEIVLEVGTMEGSATNKQRLEVLREQQELIEEENEQTDEGRVRKEAVKDELDIDESAGRDVKEEEEGMKVEIKAKKE